jgi:branched-chain amino acid transport system ATP-binding protein
MGVVLSVTDLCKNFGALQVTDHVNLNVSDGEIVGIIGPNGAGKTTLFALLAGNILPTSGTIIFGGRDVTSAPSHDRAKAGMARTYQVPRPFGHMSVFDNLKVAAMFGGGMADSEAIDRVNRVLAMTGLKRDAEQLAGRLPLLTRKRLELARALAMRPRLLLIDEVAAGLTDQEVEDFIRLVRNIRASGPTVIWIEHVMKTMLTATDRLIALHSGAVIADGAPQDVFNAPEVRRVYLGV